MVSQLGINYMTIGELGLDRYDEWEIVKKTGGKLETDRFWIKF